jgi:thymidylate synthase (FAD)
VQPLFPLVWEAFQDYRMQGMLLTRLEIGVINRLASSGRTPPYSTEDFLAAQDEAWRLLQRSRERDECREKLVHMGLLAD